MYDEELVRANINKVKHPKDQIVAQPTKQREIIVEVPTDFVEKNQTCGRTVSRLNLLRVS